MTKIYYPKIGVVRATNGKPVKTKESKTIPYHRAIYETYVPPKLKTAYRYYEKAVVAWSEETDVERRAALRKVADKEASNVYRIAFGSEK
jgi:hypothetical protein